MSNSVGCDKGIGYASTKSVPYKIFPPRVTNNPGVPGTKRDS